MLAVNLAATVARADRNTLLVIADPRSTAPALLGVQGGAGLAEVLRKGAALDSVAKQARSVSGLRVVGPGPHLADEVEDLEGAGIGPALDEAAKAAAVVLVLAPPTSRSADAQTLARLSDGALLVVELEHSESAHIRDAVRQLELVGTPMPGAVVFPQLQSRPMAIDPLERASAAAKAR
jgi:Mrp family chromosome partitioning ATPase